MSAYSRSGLDFAEVLDAAAFPDPIEAIAITVKHDRFCAFGSSYIVKKVFGLWKIFLRTN